MPRMELRIREVDKSRGGALRQAQGPAFSCTVSELAELADTSCARVKVTARGINAKNGNSAYAKLTLKRVQNLKVQMEELQWGFPIATPLSLNKPTSINGK